MPIQFDLKKYKQKVFVETGTFYGEGCIDAINSGFEIIHSIEVYSPNLEIAKKNLEPYDDKADINLYLGDSALCLSEVLESVSEPATFWLDGHGGYAGAGVGIENCP